MNANFFTFVVLRYVHDAISGETVNVGLVVHWPDSGELRVRVRSSLGRVRHLFPDTDRGAFLNSLRSIKRSLVQTAKTLRANDMFARETDALKIARTALPQDDSAFQWSLLGRGIAEDREEEFDELYQRIVSHYDGEPRANRSDEAVWRPVRESLAARSIDIHFHEKSISGETDQITFENAWKNGSWHAYQAISLDLSTPENILDKARRWRGQMVGVAEGANGLDSIELNFLLGKPQDPKLQDAYEQALAIFRRLPLQPRIFAEDQLAELVDGIEEEYRAHKQHESARAND